MAVEISSIDAKWGKCRYGVGLNPVRWGLVDIDDSDAFDLCHGPFHAGVQWQAS